MAKSISIGPVLRKAGWMDPDDAATLKAALRNLHSAVDLCLANRGAFSCADDHDGRCDSAAGGECSCGRAELDAAMSAASAALARHP